MSTTKFTEPLRSKSKGTTHTPHLAPNTHTHVSLPTPTQPHAVRTTDEVSHLLHRQCGRRADDCLPRTLPHAHHNSASSLCDFDTQPLRLETWSVTTPPTHTLLPSLFWGAFGGQTPRCTSAAAAHSLRRLQKLLTAHAAARLPLEGRCVCADVC
jgi:hypothetical protein